MRPIKFRAWDKENEVMIYPKGILFDGRVVNFSCGILEPFEGCELMQYTGLKDKNGKEIYEGDIVRVEYESNRLYLEGFEITGEVIWSPEHAQFLVKTVKTNVKHLKDGSTEYDLYEIADNEYYEVLEIKVIGNVFEDSHLLEEQHAKRRSVR